MICIALLLLSREARAAGVDGLRDSARDALRRGDPAQAVADLRRARASILASERERELREELVEAERVWFAALAKTSTSLAIEPRIRELLAIRREAGRVGSAAGLAAVESALEASLVAVWEARDPGLDDAANLRLLARLTETLGRPSALDPIAASYKAAVRGKVDAFSLRGVDGEYVRERLAYYYRLRESAPADPHPAAWSMRPGSWQTGSCGAPLDGVRQAFEKRPGVPVEVAIDTARCTVTESLGAGTEVVRWEETVLVPKTERVIKRSKVIERTPTEYRQCFATYTTTTGGPRTDGRPGYVQNYMKSGENCVSTSSYREDEVEVESVEYKSHTETETRQRSAELTTRTRRTTLAYAIAARVRIEADEHAIALDDKVEYDEVEYANPQGAGATFAPSVRSVLDPRFAAQSRAALEELILRNVRRSRVTELRAALEAEPERSERREAMLAEIAALEAAGPRELVQRISSQTRLPAPAITAALLGGRRDADLPFTDEEHRRICRPALHVVKRGVLRERSPARRRRDCRSSRAFHPCARRSPSARSRCGARRSRAFARDRTRVRSCR